MAEISEDELLKQFEIAKELIDKDPNEAGMLLYKIAESSLIILANKYVPYYYEKIIKSKNTKIYLLFEIANELSKKLNKNFKKYWYEAWELRIESHEYNLTSDFLKERIKTIEKIINFIKHKKK
ncbi:MAG: PaREP1 family protein [Thermoproteota archaeon]|jgi:hypothetical protein|nr:PaREP1 family protein [Thermoproteota archaeon]